MNPLVVISVLAATWWLGSLAVLLLSFAAALAYPRRRRKCPTALDSGLSAIVPITSLHPGFDDAQRSLFSQDYTGLEIIISVRETDSPAIAAICRIQQEFPAVRSRLVRSHCDSAVSPKMNTMWQGICDARNDLVLTKDSNLSLEPGEVADLVRHLGPGIGLVSTIAIATNPQSLAAWVESSILNCYHARVLMLAEAVGLGFGLGKVMLFRRSDLMRAGGFESVAWALGEDMALAQSIAGIGLRAVLAGRVSHQHLGNRSFSDLWQRQLRWMVIWRVQLPAVFIGDIAGSALPSAIAGAAAATLLGLAPGIVFGATLAAWFCVESVLCAQMGWPISPWSALGFLGREIVTPILWLRACTTSEVSWAGTVHTAGRRAPVLRSPAAETNHAMTRDFDK